jgi:reverse gyrase|tara:strand:+ start:87 stop:311 length:225 start_codon:yes stop_codon:yes gene_type:complete
MNEDVLEILKALTAKIEMLEKAVYNDDNLLMKSGLVVVESPTPSMNVQKSSGVPDVANMEWSEIHDVVKKLAGE